MKSCDSSEWRVGRPVLPSLFETLAGRRVHVRIQMPILVRHVGHPSLRIVRIEMPILLRLVGRQAGRQVGRQPPVHVYSSHF